MIVTIDGDDAKDLDDAISLKKLDDGNYIEVTHTKHLPNNDCFYMSPSNEKYFRENREIFKGCEVHPYNRNTYNNANS